MNLSKEEAAEVVKKYLSKVRIAGNITLTVDADDIWRGSLSWRVPVRPSRWPERMTDYYEALAEIEQIIAERIPPDSTGDRRTAHGKRDADRRMNKFP